MAKPLPQWLSDVLADFGAEADTVMEKHGLNSELVEHLATTLSFEEFNQALDLLMKQRNEQPN